MNVEEAIRELKHYCNLTQYWKNVEYTKLEFDDYIKTVLNLIEKQSKEIEVLKDTNKKLYEMGKQNAIQELINNDYISKDKIRKKVIEIKNRPVKDEFITATQAKLNTIIEIESLLEKE